MTDYIFKEVNRLINKYKTRDVFELIDCLGIHVVYNNNLKNLKGFYCISNRERYIVINANLDERDTLLVAAHELGHDRLHQSMAKVSPMRDFMLYDMNTVPEYQANTFAAELLIDDKEIIECANDENTDFMSMCKTLGYNHNIVTFKLYNMIKKGHHLNTPYTLNSKFLNINRQ